MLNYTSATPIKLLHTLRPSVATDAEDAPRNTVMNLAGRWPSASAAQHREESRGAMAFGQRRAAA